MGLLDPESVQAIDRLRAHGATYDEVAEGLAKKGIPAKHVHKALDEYVQTVDEHGRPRHQVNPGDPYEQGVQ